MNITPGKQPLLALVHEEGIGKVCLMPEEGADEDSDTTGSKDAA